MKRYAFTMLELIFVIVVMGIIGKFGTEFLAQAYKSFIFTNVNHNLQSSSDTTVEFIASILQNRIKDSIIVRTGLDTTPVALSSAVDGTNYTVLEWISSDIEGFRGSISTAPNWSGIIDIDLSSATSLRSPETNTTLINDLVKSLSHDGSTINDIGLYFIGSNSDTLLSYGWSGKLNNQNGAIHPVKADAIRTDTFVSSNGANFAGIDIFEYYKLVWTANAIVYVDDGSGEKGSLVFYYDYQPWNGDKIKSNDTKSSVIMENVSTFQFKAIGSIIKIQVCTKTTLIERYSICKEKTIF